MIADGLMTCSTSKGPMKRGDSLRDSVLSGMSLADSHTFCPRVYVGAALRQRAAYRRWHATERHKAQRVILHARWQRWRWC